MRHALAASLLLAASSVARAEPPVSALEHALPAGWSLIETDDELVIRHDKPCYTASKDAPAPQPPAGMAPPPIAPVGPPKARPPGQLVALELRYKLQARWTDKQLADARATNARLDAELRVEFARLHIGDLRAAAPGDELAVTRLPQTPDERTRYDAYERAAARVGARRVALPVCDLGDSSLFAGADTFALVGVALDPPACGREAYQAIAAVGAHCTPLH